MPQEQHVVASNTKACLLSMLQIRCDSGFILLVRKEVLFIRVLESYLRSPHPTWSAFHWSPPPAFPVLSALHNTHRRRSTGRRRRRSPVLSALHNIAHCMVVGSSPCYPGGQQQLSILIPACCLDLDCWVYIQYFTNIYLVILPINLDPLFSLYRKCCGRCANVDSPGGIEC